MADGRTSSDFVNTLNLIRLIRLEVVWFHLNLRRFVKNIRFHTLTRIAIKEPLIPRQAGASSVNSPADRGKQCNLFLNVICSLTQRPQRLFGE